MRIKKETIIAWGYLIMAFILGLIGGVALHWQKMQ